MPTESEISSMLTELSEILEDCGIPTMRGDKIGAFTSKLIVVEAYADGALEIITEGGHPASVESIGSGVSIIKAVY